MALQDTASTAGILAELNNRLTSYESTIRELRSKNRDFVNRLRDSQQIRKDLCIKVNSLQNDLEKRDKELKTQKEQNKQLKKRVTNLNELNSNYQNKIEELKSVCEKLRSSVKNDLNSTEDLNSFNSENANNSSINVNEKRSFKITNDNSISHSKYSENSIKRLISNSNELNETKNSITQQEMQLNQNKSLLVKKGDLKFSVEEINDLNMKYIPVPDDPIDRAIATFTNSRENKILFTRVKQGTYVYGRLMVEAKLVTKPGVDKNKPLLRIVSRGKLYTLADFVNTHENEELNNIEDSIRNQNGNLVSDGQALVVASPLNKFRTAQVLTPSSPIKITASSVQQNPTSSGKPTTNIQHFIQSPLSYASNRIPIIDSKHNQGVNLQNYMASYPSSTHEVLSTQSTNSIVTQNYYNNINGLCQQSPISHNKSSFIQLPQIVPHQFPYYHHLSESSNLNNHFNQNLSYHSKSSTSLISPPPVAEYMPVTTPIMMARQPISTLNCTNNSGIQQIPTQNISQSTTMSNEFKPPTNNKLDNLIQNEERDVQNPNHSLPLYPISKASQQNIQSSESISTKNISLVHNKNVNDGPISIKEMCIDSHHEDDLNLSKNSSLTQKNAINQSSSPIKSVSASTIGEWYRQASILKKCNSYSCENFSVTSNKNV